MCLSIKTFHDNDRLVISIDGLPKSSSEDIAKVFLKALVSDTKAVEDTAAMPVMKDREDIPNTHIFTVGPFKGLTPEQAMNKSDDLREQEKICYNFSIMLDSDLDDGLKRGMLAAGRDFLKRRFEGCDPDGYEAKLNDKQLLSFYARYTPFITQEAKVDILQKNNCVNWTEFLIQGADVLRTAVADVLKSFT